MDIHIRIQGQQGLARQIYSQLRTGIMDGRLAAGDRLPSTRDLAARLGVSRKTTLEAYERLGSEGYLQSRPGDGTFVSDNVARLASPPSPQPAAQARPAPIWSRIPAALSLPRPADTLPLDFLGGVTDKTLFPFDAWRRCISRAVRAQAHGRGAYRDTAGEQELRLAISRYLAFNRAITCAWQEILVTQGAQQALDLLARVVLQPGDLVAVEDPGYPPARACFTALGAKVVPVPVDEQGIIVDKLPGQARLIYVTPSHQFPLGTSMSLERRSQLLEWAQRRGAVIIEDDYDGEYRFEGRPMDPLKSLDRTGLVAYVGSFSKTIFPELRVGYVVPPASLLAALNRAKQLCDWHGSTLTQTALAHFMLDGDFAKHLRRMHKYYAARRQTLLARLGGELAPWFEPVAPSAGIHMVARLKQPLTEKALVDAARGESIGLYGIAAFYMRQPAQQGLLFGYGGMGLEKINAALDKLRDLLPRIAPP